MDDQHEDYADLLDEWHNEPDESEPESGINFDKPLELGDLEEWSNHLRGFLFGEYLDEHPEEIFLKDDYLSEGYLIIVQSLPGIENAERIWRGETVKDDNIKPIWCPPTYLKTAWGNAFKNMHKDDRQSHSFADGFGTEDGDTEVEATDLLMDLELLFDERDRQIMYLRLDGQTDAQIGVKLGLRQSRVQEIRAKMEDKYERYINRR